MRTLMIWILIVFTSMACSSSTQHKNKPYIPTVMISIDGFANFYLDKFKPPHMTQFADNGVIAQSLISIFPTKTFPNHLSIVTGNYPVTHSIVHNKFYHRALNKRYKLGLGKFDERWLTSPTLWSVAEKNNVKTAIYFWPESEIDTQQYKPSYSLPYKHNTPNAERFDQIVNWLKLPVNERPELVLGYFSTVDSAGHDFGLNSKELSSAVLALDTLFGHFVARLKNELPFDVNIILVSDHGMIEINKEPLPYSYLFEHIEGIQIVKSQTQLYVYLDDKTKEESIYKKLKNRITPSHNEFVNIYKFDNFPEHWRFNARTPVIPNIILDVVPPYTFGSVPEKGKATHGYDPLMSTKLDAIFIAKGPSFKKNMTIEPFENIHIFPLLMNILNIKDVPAVDGKVHVLSDIVKK